MTVTVEVNSIPDLEVTAPVTTTPDADVQLYAASHQSDLSYHWFSSDSFSCSDCRITDLFPTKSQIVYVEATSSLGCMIRDSVFIEVESCDANSVFMPNTFTPNGDGINDKFFIRSKSLTSLKYFRIFNVWGELVFQTNNLNEGWDGSTNGKINETGVYVYELEGKCQNGYDIKKTGNITAVR
jgi:gliding motility-associated-like protein